MFYYQMGDFSHVLVSSQNWREKKVYSSRSGCFIKSGHGLRERRYVRRSFHPVRSTSNCEANKLHAPSRHPGCGCGSRLGAKIIR